jgi:hypothetical protein
VRGKIERENAVKADEDVEDQLYASIGHVVDGRVATLVRFQRSEVEKSNALAFVRAMRMREERQIDIWLDWVVDIRAYLLRLALPEDSPHRSVVSDSRHPRNCHGFTCRRRKGRVDSRTHVCGCRRSVVARPG